jgi:hypothetical protein
MKLYNAHSIKSLQNEIKTGNIKMNVFKDFSFLTNKITSGEITLRGFFDTSLNRKEVEFIIYNTDINSEYLKEWKKSAIGKFLIKDYKSDNRDFMGNLLYYEIYYTHNDIKYKGIIRLLNEISDPEISDADKDVLISDYGDIKIDDRYFSIIKLCFDNDKTAWETEDSFIFRNKNITDNDIQNYSSIIENITTDEEIDDNYQDPLF